MSNYDKIKVLVVGDSGVGKTSVVHLICHEEPLTSPSWTVGCALDVKIHAYKAGTPQQKMYFVDMWDVGGSSGHRNSRGVFYNGVNGIVLVHDLANRKSEGNLQKWLMEIYNRDSGNSKDDDDFDPEQFVGTDQIPIIVVGTKMDLAEKSFNRPATARNSPFADECGAEEIFLNCLDSRTIAPGTSALVRLCRFLDRVVESRFHHDPKAHSYLDRKKIYPPTNKHFSDDYY